MTVCILGMHRSGTSSLAGCLEALGLFLGEVVNSAPHNRKGNKENLVLRDINDAVLAQSGGSWDSPPSRLTWDDELRQRRDQHIASYDNVGLWGFKDPRAALTLPFWQEALPDLRLVGTFRRPELVVASMMKRPGLAPKTSALELWKIYNRKLLAYAETNDMPLVSFDWPTNDYLNAIENMAANLGLAPKARSEAGFYDEALRHRGIVHQDWAHTDAEAERIYTRLMEFAANRVPEKPEFPMGEAT